MRVADYIFQTLADWGVKNVFFVSGGGAMFLDDALGKEKRIDYVCCMHEQGAAIAAEGYARISNQPGVACVTTGPGGTNALTGVAGAWLVYFIARKRGRVDEHFPERRSEADE